MLVDAKDTVACRHHHVQIMADQQNAEPALVAQASDQVVKFRLAGGIDTTHRFIQHKQIGLPQECACQHNALALAT